MKKSTIILILGLYLISVLLCKVILDYIGANKYFNLEKQNMQHYIMDSDNNGEDKINNNNEDKSNNNPECLKKFLQEY